ncbi:cytochrome P450 family protein [Amycolatopsis sp. cmx-4-68]|uniref:cytochrome P450 family protein n=1 Tax=Amycolatopsis sp. cmx-4-68 TaxID=2790938 RepID=UPI00397A2398
MTSLSREAMLWPENTAEGAHTSCDDGSARQRERAGDAWDQAMNEVEPMTVNLFDWERAHESARAAREQGSVHPATLPNGVRVWVIGGYDDALAALVDQRLRKDGAGLRRILGAQLARLGKSSRTSRMYGSSILFLDNPRHDELRGLVSALFKPRPIESLRPRIEFLVTQLLADLPRDTPVDLIAHLAFPLPLLVICELLGVPTQERAPFRAWTAAMMEDDPDRVLEASDAMEHYFGKLIVAKRAEPDDALLSTMVQLHDQGDLSAEELMDMVILLFVAGHEASTNLIGNGIQHLLAEPRAWRSLGAEPNLIPSLIEEILRFDSPIRMAPMRWTEEPVRYGDVTIPAGEIVLVSLLSAGRDPHQYPHPNRLDIHRNATHLGFGQGIHYCLGAPLARLETQVVFDAVVRQFPRARLAVASSELCHKPSMVMNGIKALPVILGR